jgi:hypothetical protein
MTRQLHVIPIVHTPEDLGNLLRDGPSGTKAGADLGVPRFGQSDTRLFWRALSKALKDWDIDYDSLQIFQDSLPVTPPDQESLIGEMIRDLAAQGSQNHQILEWFLARGARVVGTEDPQLLLAEYELMRGVIEHRQSDEPRPRDETVMARKATDLLERRDRFIAERIKEEIGRGQMGMIFLGMQHRVERFLADDITVGYPFGKPRAVA